VHCPIVGDVKRVLTDLADRLEVGDYDEWRRHVLELKKIHGLTYKVENEGKIQGQRVVEEIHRATGGDAIITTDVGQHQMWAAQYFRFKRPRQLISSGGLGTMGFGLPSALGAQIAFPEATVVDIAGDGSFQMMSHELATATQYNLPVKVVILNNRFLGMVRQWQDMFLGKRYVATDLSSSPDFIKLAESYGALGIRVEEPDDVRSALDEALAVRRPVLLDFRIECESNVYPMVPAGGGLHEMILPE